MLFATTTAQLAVVDDGHKLRKGPNVSRNPSAVAFTNTTSCLPARRSYMVKESARNDLNANLMRTLKNVNVKQQNVQKEGNSFSIL